MATVIDVAREAGVSTATVSRAINGSALVSEKARRAVFDAAKKLGYEITPGMPRSGNSRFIAVIVTIDVMELETAIVHAAAEAGYLAVFLHVTHEAGDDFYLNTSLKQLDKQLAGVILMNDPVWYTKIELRIPEGVPVIQLLEETEQPDRVYIGSDNFALGADAAQYLIDAGCRRISTALAVNDRKYAQQMARGCRFALIENGIEPGAGFEIQEDMMALLTSDDPAGILAAQLDPDDLPDGIFCVADAMALHLIPALNRLGKKVPEDIRMITVSGQGYPVDAIETLPYIRHDFEAIAAEAVSTLLSEAEGRSQAAKRILVPHSLQTQGPRGELTSLHRA